MLEYPERIEDFHKSFCCAAFTQGLISFQDDAEAAKYVYKVSLLQQNFHRQSHDKLLLSDSELGFSNDGVGPITTHMV